MFAYMCMDIKVSKKSIYVQCFYNTYIKHPGIYEHSYYSTQIQQTHTHIHSFIHSFYYSKFHLNTKTTNTKDAKT